MAERISPLKRFEAKVVADPETGCWNWQAWTTRGGYGKFKVDGHTRVSHRWYYQQVVGPVPAELQLDHLCRNRACCNPEHLEPVTCRENLLRGDTFQASNAAKVQCPKGHPLSGENLMVSGGRRVCRTCKRAATAKWRAANLEKARLADRESARQRRAARR